MGADRNIWRAGPGRGHRIPQFHCPECGEKLYSVFKANAHQCSKEVEDEGTRRPQKNDDPTAR